MRLAHRWSRTGTPDNAAFRFYFFMPSLTTAIRASIAFFVSFALLGIAAGVWAQCPPNCKFENPIKSQDFVKLLESVSKTLRQYAIPLAVFAIIIVGVWLVVAGASGNESQVAKAKQLLFWAVVGAAIVAGATVLVEAARLFAVSLGG